MKSPRAGAAGAPGPDALSKGGAATEAQTEETDLYSRDDPYVLSGLCLAPFFISIAYLGLSYGSTRFLCAAASNVGMRIATLMAGTLIALFLARFSIAVFRRCFGGRRRRPFAPRRTFLVKTAASLGLLATFGLLWSGAALIVVNKCAGSAA